jgi:ABC-type bacteriocin/lantibiotic exporter with double-glycine peptidase domain
MKLINKFLYLLSSHEKRRAYLLLGMIITMAFIDMLGIASILPFIAILTNPQLIETNYILKSAFEFTSAFGVVTDQQFLFVLGIFVFLFLLFSLSFKAITFYFQVRFISMREHSLAKRLVEGYLHQPYSWFLSRHSAELGKTILSEISKVAGKGLASLLNLIAQSAVTIAIIILLILVEPKLTMIVGFTLGAAYLLIFKSTQSFVNRIGKESVKVNATRYIALNEAFSAAKEIKLGGLEKIYIERFSEPSKSLAKYTAFLAIIGQIPRFALEAITFGGMILVTLYLTSKAGNFISTAPILALYAFAGYRLMPALQQIYFSITLLNFTIPALDSVYDDLKSLQPYSPSRIEKALPLKKDITLKNLHYNYPNATRIALKDINFIIQARSTVGLVGSTGSGKTTTVDIILGLLEAQKGTLEVDGKAINKNNRNAWQRSIGYVPQRIFLSDNSVAANIAFGIDPKDINQDAVEHASKIANLHEFIINELPLQYQTTVGENGVRLSGGQRQRIGIARALYHNPQVLILDEATNALDNLTERAVMDAVQKLRKNMTIIIIAHRLSTLKNCDNILLLEKGELKEQGTFEKLMQVNQKFKEIAKNP